MARRLNCRNSVRSITELFDNETLVTKIKNRLPALFQRAKLAMSRRNGTQMAVGILREQIIVALLIYQFGKEGKSVDLDVSVTEPEFDVKLYGKPISIKTKTSTSKNPGGFKLIWTVDKQKSRQFRDEYKPSCDILLVHIRNDKTGGFYYIPLESQQDVFNFLRRENYIKLPKEGTNPRGVEINGQAVKRLLADERTRCIPIEWIKQDVQYNPYERWLELWDD